jgi:hypothetical protein
MSGWLDLPQPGLSPGKKRQASLGALTLPITICRPDRDLPRSLRTASGRQYGATGWLGRPYISLFLIENNLLHSFNCDVGL